MMAAADLTSPLCQLPRRWFLAVLVLAMVVRGGTLVWLGGNLHEDPDAYRQLAQNVINTGTYGLLHRSQDGVVQPSAYRPPLYALLLAACLKAPGEAVLNVAGLHLALGVASVALVMAVGRRIGLGRAATAAGLLVACDPILLHQSTLLMTETAATFLAVVALFCLVWAGERPTARRAGLAGASLALALLCRPAFLVALATAGLLFVVLASTWRQRWSVAAALLISAMLVLLPWVVRNAIQMKRPIVTTTHGGYTFRLGNNPSFYAYLRESPWGAVWSGADSIAPGAAVRAPPGSAGTPFPGRELAIDRWYYAEALRTVREQRGMFLWACLVRLARFWQLVPHQVDPRESAWRSYLRYAVGCWYLVEFALAAAGLWAVGRAVGRPPWVWGLILCGSLTLVHLFYWSNMRMRAPIMPVVALLAAAGLDRLTAMTSRRKSIAKRHLEFKTADRTTLDPGLMPPL